MFDTLHVLSRAFRSARHCQEAVNSSAWSDAVYQATVSCHVLNAKLHNAERLTFCDGRRASASSSCVRLDAFAGAL